MGQYQFFDHTADIGLEIEAATFADLLETSVAGLAEMIVAEPEQVNARMEQVFDISGDEASLILFDTLNQVIFLFETEHFVPRHAAVTRIGTDDAGEEAEVAGRWQVRLFGEPLDNSRHPLGHEVKAVTYHDLEAVKEQGGWRARVIFDI